MASGGALRTPPRADKQGRYGGKGSLQGAHPDPTPPRCSRIVISI